MNRRKINGYFRKGMGLVEWGVVFGVIIAALAFFQSLIRRPISHSAVGLANYMMWNNSSPDAALLDGQAVSKMRVAQHIEDNSGTLETAGGIFNISVNQSRQDRVASIGVGSEDGKIMLDNYDF